MDKRLRRRASSQWRGSSFLKKILILGVLALGSYFVVTRWLSQPLELHQEVMINEGDSFAKFSRGLSSSDQWRLKYYTKTNEVDTSSLAVGLYRFSGEYTAEEFFALIAEGPKQDYVAYTILEWWSIYDIDASLTQKWYIKAGEYIAYVTDVDRIRELSTQYDFLAKVLAEEKKIVSLEGFLYPDTYFLDLAKPVLPQLMRHHLQTFDRKVWQVYGAEFASFEAELKAAGYKKLSLYETMILASIIEKEERVDANKPIIAGIFLERLKQKMLLGADVTLCYGLKKPYEACPPSVIVEHLYDKSNSFNTRQNGGLLSQPIANIADVTFAAVLEFEQGGYLYYLHDNSGQIHYAKTLQEHNLNKSKYLP